MAMFNHNKLQSKRIQRISTKT